MKSANQIRRFILIGLILTGIYVWILAPAMTGPNLFYKERDTEPDMPKWSDALSADVDAGYLILVNKENALEKEYKPSDLKEILYYAPDRSPEGRYLREAAADAFHDLVNEAAKQNIELVLTTGYRSYGFQSILYNNYVEKDGQAEADKYSAQPGKSEHQTGLAADVSASSVDYQLVTEFENTSEGKWLSENAGRFGFILRYSKDKEEMTGYMFEPWHIRYVGIPAAEYIREHEITLEEYLQLFN